MSEITTPIKNQPEETYFLSEILGTRVIMSGKKVGKLTDLVIRENGSLPVVIGLCETDSTSSACLAAPSDKVSVLINAGTTKTFGIFLGGLTHIPFDPGANRIIVRFKDGAGVLRGATSVAVRTR